MKIPAFLTCLLAVLLAAVPLHRAQADEVSFDVFYNSLADDGDWYNTPEYGYVWQPYVAYKTDKWRPYSDGYWAQTDDGWTWVSYENFGWATYHYGRWTRLKDTGWVWVPGYDWGPGWVSWRTNDDYVGWAPLPPKVEDGVYEGRVVERRSRVEQIDYSDVEPEDAGYGTNVDVQYDIGPANYCFVETRNFGAPVLGEVLLPPQQNFVFIERTRNVTNIYYRRERERTVVYNNGPDFAFINGRVDRPIPRLRIERHDDAGFLSNGLRGGGNPTLVRNGILSVATPMISRRPMNYTQVKPTRVKQTIEQPQVVRGWSNPGTDLGATQRIRDQYKQQAASAPPRPANPVIPPPAPARERGEDRAAGSTPPAPNGAQPFQNNGRPNQPGAPLTEAERIARRDARQKEREQRANGQPAAPNATNPVQPPGADQDKEARRAARQAARASGQPANEAATPAPAAQANSDPDKEARRAARQAARANGQPAAPTAPPEAVQQNADPDKEARRAARQSARANGQPAQPAEATQPPNRNRQSDEERAARRAAREAAQAPQAQPQPQANAQADPEREVRRAARQQQERAGQQPAPQAQAAQEQEARRAARQQERANQPPAPQQVQPQQEQEARRAARQQERATQQPAPQPQQAQAPQEQEARRAARQQERAAQQAQLPPQQRQPQAQPQPQPQNGNGGRERGKEDGQNKPGRSPAP